MRVTQDFSDPSGDMGAVGIRRLSAEDEPMLSALLGTDQGHGLFITSNMLSYGFGNVDVRYWGDYHVDAVSGFLPVLHASLMVSSNSATIFAPEGYDPTALATIALHEPLRFIMGRADLMACVPALAGPHVENVEHHYFADLTRQRFITPEATLPPETMVRLANLHDVDGLARLYYGATGFEKLSLGQVRNVMHTRVTHYRTTLAESMGEVLAAASTSAESYTAAMIGGVWTAPWARGRGLSTAVVAALCADLFRSRLRPYLFFLTDNGPAEHVYLKLGFRVTDTWQVIYLK